MNRKSLKNILKDLIPPYLLKSINKIMWSSRTYKSYEDAIKNADGYEYKLLTKVVVAKGKRFSKDFPNSKEIDLKSLRIFAGLAASINKNKLTIIDFGGGAGTHYFIAKSIFSQKIELDWRVVETPTMVAEAKKHNLENKELRFFETVEIASGNDEVDLIFASSSIHYTSKPYDFLKTLASVNAKVLMITRTPITDNPCVLLQRSTLSANGVGDLPRDLNIVDKVITYPATMMDRQKVEEICSTFGKICLRILEDKAAFNSDKDSYDMWGYIVKKIN